jgi:DNA mismatch repair protein MutS
MREGRPVAAFASQPMDKLTPMFRQYHAVKQQYPDVLLLFRMGDFYELFGEDAEVAARELELTLTSREAGKGKRIPMCGVPYHAVEKYLARLIKKGFRAAICDQVEDPKAAKGLVQREVTRVVTPGTVLEDAMLERGEHNFLVALDRSEGRVGLAAVDVSTGDFLVTEFGDGDGSLADELARIRPAECLLAAELHDDPAVRELVDGFAAAVVRVEEEPYRSQSPAQRLAAHFGVSSLRGYGCEDMAPAVAAAACILDYLRDNHFATLSHLSGITTYSTRDYMVLDAATRRNLELTQTIRTGSREGSVLALIDRTVTPMGARLCRQWLLQPLLDLTRINDRLDAVEELLGEPAMREALTGELRKAHDIERLVSRAAAGTANARDLRALCGSLRRLPAVLDALGAAQSPLLTRLAAEVDPLEDVAGLIDEVVVDDPPAQLNEGGIIRPGVSADLDELRSASASGKGWIAALETSERNRTGIKSLKVGYNQVFGYYIEVSRPNLHLVPDDYIRKQTLVSAERFVTPALKEQEAKVLGAEEKIAEIEYELFTKLRENVAAEASRVLKTARALAQVDVLAGFAVVAVENAYTKPTVHDGDGLTISEGRHPVVEGTLTDRQFVPNDALLDCGARRMTILTGPNMAGKSTYLRQVALIALMAQIGCFVPARAAKIGLVDRIFTRVGAMDDLATGQSTFMVEMNETANILHNATPRSLIVLDEIGRGTSTFDGLSIAWAVAEYIIQRVGAKTLFATHYHHLNELAEIMEGVVNCRVAVKESGDSVTFLYKIIAGGTDRSYGIEVGRLAGLPPQVIERAQQVLRTLESDAPSGVAPRASDAAAVGPPVQLRLFEAAPDPLIQSLKALDIDSMTPLDALTWLSKAREEAQGREG